jgi:LPXTG-motif cell wall-anchored protein
MRRVQFLAVAVACLLALPAVALAQSAPDTQYQDPLANPNTSKSTPKSSSGPSSTTPSPGSSNGAGTSGSGTAGTSSSAGTASTGTATTSGLPRTGGHPELLALAGAALLGGGFALRRAARA